MEDQTLLLVDEKDNFVGYAPREECHTGQGKRHRAFVTLLFDSQNRVLLQKRKHKLFDGLWDFTAISHPLRINGKTESYQQASDRALNKEMGIGHVQVKKIGGFNYFAHDGKYCENEYCAVLVGNYDGKVKPNKQEVYSVQRITYEKFLADIESHPQVYTPWAKKAIMVCAQVTPDTLQIELKNFLEEFNKFSNSFFTKKRSLVQKYPKLIDRFYSEIDDFRKGGKAIRPFLVYLGYKIAGGKSLKPILPICLAVELIHSFLLIHDDIIDKSDKRRNKPTVHKRFERNRDPHYGVSQAIVAGDIALVEAISLINDSKLNNSLKSKCIGILANAILHTGYGEVLDIDYVYNTPTIDDIRQMTKLKTAQYSFVGPLKMGTTVGKGSKSQLAAIENYGIACGGAFQLKDDILGVYGKEEVLGKSVLSDMREGKNTVLSYKARELARGSDFKYLERAWGSKSSNNVNLRKIQVIMEKSGAKKWCEDEMQKLVIVAKKTISKITNDKKLQKLLNEIADFAIIRES